MRFRQFRRFRRRQTVLGTVTALGLCAGVWLIDHHTATAPPPQPSVVDTASDAGDGRRDDAAGAGRAPAVAPLPASTPTRVRVPGAGVDARVMKLGLDEDGTLLTPPPEEKDLSGWYKDGTAPGATGTAVIVGHVDNSSGPSVFYGLGSLKKGATVEVDRQDRRTAVFTVDSVQVHSRDDFPDRRVYGPSSRPELRLITCGGGYSEKSGYLGNVVVYAHLSKTR